MKKIYNHIINLGVYDDTPVQLQKRIRFANFLELYSLVFYLLYLILGFIVGSTFMTVVSFCVLLSGPAGMYMNKRRRYALANFIFLSAFNLLLLFCCNSLSNGKDYIVFFLPTLFSYVILYDFEKDLPNALLNLSVSVACMAGVFLLPQHLLVSVNVGQQWTDFFFVFNYCTAFIVAMSYMLFIANHIKRNGRELQAAYIESERQKEAYLEQKICAENATAAKSQFFSNMSHELRTPLNGIIGTVHLLLQEEMLPAHRQHYKVLKYSSEHMLSLINDVLDFSKIEAGQMDLSQAPFNLKQSLQKVHDVFEKRFAERNIRLIFDTSDFLDRDFISDETRLNQVLTNLISNALKFSKQGSVRCSVNLVSATSQSAQIRFCVEDTGIGISEEQQQYIFDAFRQAESNTTRRFGGTGLGLTISKKIVSMLGGDLQVTSRLNHGSTFHFTVNLPFSEQKRAFVDDEMVNSLQNMKGARVLIVDDSFVNRRITRRFLERWEVEMDEAANGNEALDLFYKNRYDVLLIDLHMPVLDGYETIAAIRKVDQSTPALAFTAAILPDMRRKLLEHGFSDFLQKPFRPEDLHRKISSSYMQKQSA